jgi:hypothetical protein
MVLPMLACQMRTVTLPCCGMRAASISPMWMAQGPTAAERLPQLPLQSTKGLVDGDLAKQVVHIVPGPRAARQDHGLAGARRGVAQAVDLLAIRVGAAQHAQQQAVARGAGLLGGFGQVLQA